jgi:hypothetical protein
MQNAEALETTEVPDIDGQQLSNAMNIHARCQASVMDLHTLNVMGDKQGFLAARSTNVSCNFGSIYIPPRLLQIATGGADWVIEARVDSRGRVSDYRIISNADGLADLSPQIKGSLIFTTFQPATYMGRPISATAILTFPKHRQEAR